MPVRKTETLYVFGMIEGWMICSQPVFKGWGPYSTEAQALEKAKQLALRSKRCFVKLKNALGQWELAASYGMEAPPNA
jgi:hypothetical protein